MRNSFPTRAFYPLFCLLLLTACSKNDPDTPGNSPEPNPSPVVDPSCRITAIYLGENPGDEDKFVVTDSSTLISRIQSSTKDYRFAYTIAGARIHQQFFKNHSTGNETWTQYAHSPDYVNIAGVYRFAGNLDNGYNTGVTDYTYAAGQLSLIRLYPSAMSMPNNFTAKEEYTWEDGNITSIRYTTGQTVCTHRFTYDVAATNPFPLTYNRLLWQQPANGYGDFDEAVFLSKNLPVQAVPDCAGVPVKKITYTYNGKRQIRDIKIDGKTTWSFRYSCD